MSRFQSQCVSFLAVLLSRMALLDFHGDVLDVGDDVFSQPVDLHNLAAERVGDDLHASRIEFRLHEDGLHAFRPGLLDQCAKLLGRRAFGRRPGPLLLSSRRRRRSRRNRGGRRRTSGLGRARASARPAWSSSVETAIERRQVPPIVLSRGRDRPGKALRRCSRPSSSTAAAKATRADPTRRRETPTWPSWPPSLATRADDRQLLDAFGGIDDHQPLVALLNLLQDHGLERHVDLEENRRPAQRDNLLRTRLERMRVLSRLNQHADLHMLPADLLDEISQAAECPRTPANGHPAGRSLPLGRNRQRRKSTAIANVN